MRRSATLILSSLSILLQMPCEKGFAESNSMGYAPVVPSEQQAFMSLQSQSQVQAAPSAPFQAFTGKVTKNKVRLRQQPNLDSPILRELNQGDMMIVVGETDDFFAVQPPADSKGYVFRTYILDNVVEANKVNVRQEPDVDSAVIGQLSAGDRVQGTVSALNSKWLEIATPASTRFFVAKDYVEKLGDPTLMSKIEKRREEVNLLLNSTYLVSQTEMQKPFPEINLDIVYANFNKIISSYGEFQEQVSRSKELTTSLQDSYLQKKIAYLESKTKMVQEDWQIKNSQLNTQVRAQQQQLSQLEKQIQSGKPGSVTISPSGVSNKMAAWFPMEQAAFSKWIEENAGRSQDDFYQEQAKQAVVLTGILEPYTRVINNRPGDYVLVGQANNLPVAYVYSTLVNLQDKVGQQITIKAANRPNNNFAFPAYFVLEIE